LGADRKGPLAAFIVVAIIAAILLVTSVRSQAAAGWLRSGLPSPPNVVSAVNGGFDQIVEQGADLVHRSAELVPPTRPAVSTSTVPDRGPHQTHAQSPQPLDPAGHGPGTRKPHHGSADEGDDTPDPGSRGDHPGGQHPAHHDHGRHLGWTHAHGHQHGHGHAHHG
jgi:hypothetical protein